MTKNFVQEEILRSILTKIQLIRIELTSADKKHSLRKYHSPSGKTEI